MKKFNLVIHSLLIYFLVRTVVAAPLTEPVSAVTTFDSKLQWNVDYNESKPYGLKYRYEPINDDGTELPVAIYEKYSLGGDHNGTIMLNGGVVRQLTGKDISTKAGENGFGYSAIKPNDQLFPNLAPFDVFGDLLLQATERNELFSRYLNAQFLLGHTESGLNLRVTKSFDEASRYNVGRLDPFSPYATLHELASEYDFETLPAHSDIDLRIEAKHFMFHYMNAITFSSQKIEAGKYHVNVAFAGDYDPLTALIGNLGIKSDVQSAELTEQAVILARAAKRDVQSFWIKRNEATQLEINAEVISDDDSALAQLCPNTLDFYIKECRKYLTVYGGGMQQFAMQTQHQWLEFHCYRYKQDVKRYNHCESTMIMQYNHAFADQIDPVNYAKRFKAAVADDNTKALAQLAKANILPFKPTLNLIKGGYLGQQIVRPYRHFQIVVDVYYNHALQQTIPLLVTTKDADNANQRLLMVDEHSAIALELPQGTNIDPKAVSYQLRFEQLTQ